MSESKMLKLNYVIDISHNGYCSEEYGGTETRKRETKLVPMPDDVKDSDFCEGVLVNSAVIARFRSERDPWVNGVAECGCYCWTHFDYAVRVTVGK